MGKYDGLLIAGVVLAGGYLIAKNAKLSIDIPSFDLPDIPSVDIPPVPKWLDSFLGSPGVLTFNELAAQNQYPVSSYLPQVGLSNIFGKGTYTPALVGPLSSKNPADWQSWLV